MAVVTDRLQEARKSYTDGDLTAARERYQAILTDEPGHIEALHALADILYKQKDLAASRNYVQAAIERAPHIAMLYNLLGLIEQSENRLDESIANFNKALELHPKLPEACNNLGSVYQAIGELEKAEFYYRLALESTPDMPQALNNLAQILQIRGFPDKAIPLYLKALGFLPGNVIILINLGKCYRLSRKYLQAAETFRKAREGDPNNPDVLYSLGQILIELNEFEEAETLLDDAAERHPNSLEIISAKAYLAQKRGQLERARALIAPYIQTHRNQFNLAIRFASLSQDSHTQQEAINWLEELLEQDRLTHHQKQLTHFTLGKLYDELGQYDQAFRYFRSGNLMHNRSFSIPQLEKLVNQILLQFSRKRLKKLPHSNQTSDRPVFIVGMLRSGTELVNKILAQHPDIGRVGEVTWIDEIAQGLPRSLNVNQPYPLCLESVDEATLDRFAADYLKQLESYALESARIIDRMPQNFFHLGLIQMLFPNARVIHCVRDPLDTCLSAYFQLFTGYQDYTYDLSSLGQYYRMYQKLMAHWQNILDIPILNLSYEELVQNPDVTIRQLLAFCDVEFDPKCLKLYESEQEKPLHTDSVGRHTHYDQYLRPLRLALGMKLPAVKDQYPYAKDLETARRFHEQGKLQEADALYEKILEDEPNCADVLQLRGVVAYQQGRLEEAVGMIQQAIAISDDVPSYFNNLGLTYLGLGRYEEAIAQYKRGLSLNPSSPEVHNNLGIAYQNQGLMIEAEHFFQKSLDLRADYPDALNNLGSLKQSRGLIQEAMDLYRKALQINPDYVEALGNLGNCYRLLRKYEQALACYKKTTKLRPAMAELHYNSGQILADMGRWEEAEACFEKALELKPKFVDAVSGLAQLLERRGEVQLAYDRIQSIMKEGGNNSNLAVTFAAISRKLNRRPQAIKWMERLLKDQPLSHSQEQLLQFNLGKLFDDQEDYGKAFEHYKRGNQLQHAQFDPNRFSTDLTYLFEAFSAEAMARLPRATVKTDKPIFIVGMMRSGTTLVEQLLASHREVYGAGELTLLNEVAYSIPKNLKSQEPYPQCVKDLDQAMVDNMARFYLEAITRMSPEAKYITDKMPQNFYHLGLIQLLYPDAHVIHTIRNPLDTCLSCYFQLFNGIHDYAYDLSHLGYYYRQYEKLMGHWRKVLTMPILDIHYEDLVADFEGNSRKIVDFCGLDWDDNILRFYETKRDVKTASYQQVRQPIYDKSLDRYKHYESHLQPLKEALDKWDNH